MMQSLPKFLCTLLILVSTQVLAFPLVPNTEMTTGSLCTQDDPDHRENRYAEGIPYCIRNVSTGQKNQIYRAYGIPKNCWNRYTIDHFYPLSMGGSNHLDNLWPEHKLVKLTRKNLEIETFKRLENGEITQKEALKIIREDKLKPSNPSGTSVSGCDQVDN